MSDITGHITSYIETDTLNPSAALLAENQEAILDSMHQQEDRRKRSELAEWIGGILGEHIDPNTLLDDLATGVRLLHLAKTIQLIKCSHLKNSEYKEVVKTLNPEELDFTDCRVHRRASHIAKQRSNIAKFLEWCRHSGVPAITLFEAEDLVHEKNPRQVTTCLLYVSKIASRFGIEPPSSVKEEMEKEARLSGKNNLGSRHRSSSFEHLVTKKPPIAEHEENDYEYSPTRNMNMAEAVSYGRTSTPSSSSSMVELENIKPEIEPILPMQLDFEHGVPDAVVIDKVSPKQNSKLHFAKKEYIEDVQIREMQDMVIVEQLQFHPIDVPVDHNVTTLEDGTKVTMTPAFPDLNENTDPLMSDSSFETSSSSENEYFTAQDVGKYDDVTDLRYHTAFVDDVSEDEEPIVAETLPMEQDPVDVNAVGTAVTSSEDISEIDHASVTSPYKLYRVPADIVVERHGDDESSIESTTDVESYASDDDTAACDVTYNDVAVGTDDVSIPKQDEIMINFPPYFEITRSTEPKTVPSVEYIVATGRSEPVYAVPKKSKTAERSTYRNDAYEVEEESYVRPSRQYSSVEAIHAPPLTFPRSISNTSQISDKGTQTHVSLCQDIVRIINEMQDIPRIQPGSSSASSSNPTTPIHYAGNTIVMRAQYQRTLPSNDRDVAIVQAANVQSSRPPRTGSVNSSTRHKYYDAEAAAPANKAVRRSLVRRASSVISEQFEKAVVVAKRYKKQITIITVLIILVVGALAAMLAVFPLT